MEPVQIHIYIRLFPSQLISPHTNLNLAMGCALSKPPPPVPRPPRFPANWPDPRQLAVLAAQAEDERARLNISRASTHRAWNPNPPNRAVLRKNQDGSYRESGPKGEKGGEGRRLGYGVFGGSGEADAWRAHVSNQPFLYR